MPLRTSSKLYASLLSYLGGCHKQQQIDSASISNFFNLRFLWTYTVRNETTFLNDLLYQQRLTTLDVAVGNLSNPSLFVYKEKNEKIAVSCL